MLAEEYNGHIIKRANPSGGKAGKGYNRTSTIQVMRKGGSTILKSFRYEVRSLGSKMDAKDRARKFIDQLNHLNK